MLIIAGVLLVLLFPEKRKEYTTKFLEWLGNHRFTGPLVLTFVMISATVLLLPGAIITVGTGVALMKAYDSVWITIGVG